MTASSNDTALKPVELQASGKPADPEKFKGVYRLRLPLEGEVVAAPPAAGDVDE